MKNKILLLILVFLFGANFISASDSIYNWRYQGPSNEPSTSYYSGYWNSYSGSENNGYVPISQKLKTFNGPYTQVYQQNTKPYPRPSSNLKAESNNFQAGGGYKPSSSFSGGYGYYGGYSGYYGYSYYSPTYYGGGYSYSYYDYYSDYYPAYYW